jgi:hypothetical protein
MIYKLQKFLNEPVLILKARKSRPERELLS